MKVFHLAVANVLADFVGGVCKVHKREWDGKTWDLPQLWGMTKSKFWQPLTPSWFASLPLMENAHEIVELVNRLSLGNWLFVTSPPSDPGVYTAKALWLGKHWPDFRRHICICAKKHLLSSTGLLIDDSVDNCEQYPGQFVLMPVGMDALEVCIKEYMDT